MICKACGREIINENANFCEYCGTSFRENVSPTNSAVYRNEQQNLNTSNEATEQPISFGNWMGSMLLPFIPMVGPLVYIIMLFIWSFGSDAPKSKRNWARATLIVMVISLVAAIILFTPILISYFNNSDFMNEYSNLIKKYY